MRYVVILSPEAEEQILTIDSWWREKRAGSRDLFLDEMLAATALLETAPEVGRRYTHPSVHGVRRLLLAKSRHHVYYRVFDDSVVILAVWGAVRGSGPLL